MNTEVCCFCSKSYRINNHISIENISGSYYLDNFPCVIEPFLGLRIRFFEEDFKEDKIDVKFILENSSNKQIWKAETEVKKELNTFGEQFLEFDGSIKISVEKPGTFILKLIINEELKVASPLHLVNLKKKNC